MNFTAIDFETANSSRSSACAVGLTVVKDGQIVGSMYELIRPDPLYFSPFNVSIHGITAQDVVNSRTFTDLWPEFFDKIQGPLVAHNASFDISVIRSSLDSVSVPYPDLNYFCTRALAKLTWPGQPTYSLAHVAQLLGLSFEHHNAADDARTCALIAINACQRHGVSSLFELEEPFVFSAGRLYPGGYTRCHGRGTDPSKHLRHDSQKLRASSIVATATEFDVDHPFFGKSFVFTGMMTAMVRRDAMQAVVDHGGICHDQVKLDTNFLVVGQKGYLCYQFGGFSTDYTSNKMRTAEQLSAKGHNIEILSEADFISML